MTYQLVLALHLVGALATAIIALYALYALRINKGELFRKIAITVGGLAAFEILSGTLLAVLSSELTTKMVCNRLAIYLGVVATVEVMIFHAMKKTSTAFPVRTSLSPVTFGMGLFFLAYLFSF